MTRPRATHKDENHYIPRDFLRDRCGGYQVVSYGRTRAYTANYRGLHFVLFDLSDYGGVFCDWLLHCVDRDEYRWLEIKTVEAYRKPEHDMTEGERWLKGEIGGGMQFVVTDDDMAEIMDGML